MSKALAIIGLLLAFVGGVVVFFFPKPAPEGHGLLLESAPSDEERAATRKRQTQLSNVGFAMILLGTVFSIIGVTTS